MSARHDVEVREDDGALQGLGLTLVDPAALIHRRQSARTRTPVDIATLAHDGSARRATLGEHHRNVLSGGARAAVFGISDGLVTNVSLILGVAGAHASAGVVRLTGLAGLVAGSLSMAAGEYVSMQAQRELFERELSRRAGRAPASGRRPSAGS